jgi:hypothetical protein
VKGNRRKKGGKKEVEEGGRMEIRMEEQKGKR